MFGLDYQIIEKKNNEIKKNNKTVCIEFSGIKQGEKLSEKLINDFEVEYKINDTKILSLKSNFVIGTEILDLVDYVKNVDTFDEVEFNKKISNLKI